MTWITCILLEMRQTQVFQGRHLTVLQIKLVENVQTKTFVETLKQNSMRTVNTVWIFIKAVLAKFLSTVSIRIHSCVNIGMRQRHWNSLQHLVLRCMFEDTMRDVEVVLVYAGSNGTLVLRQPLLEVGAASEKNTPATTSASPSWSSHSPDWCPGHLWLNISA